MYEVTPDSLYAQIREQGQVTINETWAHLVPAVRRLAKKDGLTFGTHTTRLGKRGYVGYEQKSIGLFVHDGNGNLVFPNQEERS